MSLPIFFHKQQYNKNTVRERLKGAYYSGLLNYVEAEEEDEMGIIAIDHNVPLFVFMPA